MNTPFDLKEVRIGRDIVHARPIAWDREDFDGFGNDKDGEQMKPVSFHTTCPACAQLVEFSPDSLFTGVDGSIDNLACGSCKAGVERAKDKPAVVAQIIETQSPFVDPVAGGLMQTTLLSDKVQPFKVDE
jgi:hypothetical protein